MDDSGEKVNSSPSPQERRQREIEQARRDLEQAREEIAQAKAAEPPRRPVFTAPPSPPSAPTPQPEPPRPTPSVEPVSENEPAAPARMDVSARFHEEPPEEADSLLSDEELEALLDESVTYGESNDEPSYLEDTTGDAEDDVLSESEVIADNKGFIREQRLSLAEQIRAAAIQEQSPRGKLPAPETKSAGENHDVKKEEITHITSDTWGAAGEKPESNNFTPVKTGNLDSLPVSIPEIRPQESFGRLSGGDKPVGNDNGAGRAVPLEKMTAGGKKREKAGDIADDIMETMVLADIMAFRQGR